MVEPSCRSIFLPGAGPTPPVAFPPASPLSDAVLRMAPPILEGFWDARLDLPSCFFFGMRSESSHLPGTRRGGTAHLAAVPASLGRAAPGMAPVMSGPAAGLEPGTRAASKQAGASATLEIAPNSISRKQKYSAVLLWANTVPFCFFLWITL